MEEVGAAGWGPPGQGPPPPAGGGGGGPPGQNPPGGGSGGYGSGGGRVMDHMEAVVETWVDHPEAVDLRMVGGQVGVQVGVLEVVQDLLEDLRREEVPVDDQGIPGDKDRGIPPGAILGFRPITRDQSLVSWFVIMAEFLSVPLTTISC